jgi:hypothetical protein
LQGGEDESPKKFEVLDYKNSDYPEPATLGVLALGAPGLSIWRRKETALEGD